MGGTPGLKKEAEDHVQLQGEVKWRQEHTPFSESVPTYLQPSLVSFRPHGPYYLFFMTFSLRVWFPAKRLHVLHFRHVPHRASARIFPSYVTRMQGCHYACPRPWGLPSYRKRSHSATHLSYIKTRPFSSFWGGGWVSLGWIHMLPSSFPSFRCSLLHSSTRSPGQASSLKLLSLTLSNREIIAVRQPGETPLHMRAADAFVLRMHAIAHCLWEPRHVLQALHPPCPTPTSEFSRAQLCVLLSTGTIGGACREALSPAEKLPFFKMDLC